VKFVHITISTTDLPASITFYQEIVGLEISHTIPPGQADPSDAQIVFMGAGETKIELIRRNERRSMDAGGISLGFTTESVERLREQLTEKGLSPTEITSPNPNVKFFFVRDPVGVSVQFVEYAG
jgi:lactoylglutathione lyase